MKNDSNNIELEISVKVIIATIVYLVFVAVVSALTYAKIFPSTYYMTRYMKDVFINQPFSRNGSKVEYTFKQITNVYEFWAYCETILVEDSRWKYWYDFSTKTKLSPENVFIGKARLRQVKVKKDTCDNRYTIKEGFITGVENCYKSFSAAVEDKETFGPEEIWVYQDATSTQSFSYEGKITTYPGGGFVTMLGSSQNETEIILKKLKNNSWITGGTRCVFIDLIFYNINLDLFCFVKLIAEFSPAGGIIPSSSIKTLHNLGVHPTKSFYFILLCEVVTAGFVMIYTLNMIQGFLRQLNKWEIWTIIEIGMLSLGFSYLIISFYKYKISKPMIKRNFDLHKTIYPDFEHVNFITTLSKDVLCLFTLSLYLIIFKHLNFSKTMRQLKITLIRCAADVGAVMAMFFIVFIAYAQVGCLLYGNHIENFHKLGFSIFTLLRTLLGDFDYEEIEKVNPYLSPLFFITYIFFVFFVLLNMFLAIINDTYTDVIDEITNPPIEVPRNNNCWTKIRQFLTEWKYSHGNFGNREKLPSIEHEEAVFLEKVKKLFKQCEFNDVEIEEYLSRFNIDPTADLSVIDRKYLGETKGKCEKLALKENIEERIKEATRLFGEFDEQNKKIADIEAILNLLTVKVNQLLSKLQVAIK